LIVMLLIVAMSLPACSASDPLFTNNLTVPLDWQGNLAVAPVPAVIGMAYHNTNNGITYYYSGSWQTLASPGSNGTNGSDGANGTNGQGFTWKDAWVTGTNYSAYDVVTDDGNCYVCILAIINSTTIPGSDGTHFTILAMKGTNGTNGNDGYTPIFGVDYFNGADGAPGVTDVFTASTNGLVPSPTTSTGLFLKDDATWASPAGGGGLTDFANDPATTTGLTWGYKAGVINYQTQGNPEVSIQFAAGTIELTDGQSYILIYLDGSGVNSITCGGIYDYTGMGIGCKPLYFVTTADELITIILDVRTGLTSADFSTMLTSWLNWVQPLSSPPSPTSEYAGRFWVVWDSGGGVAAILYICLPGSDDNYHWVKIVDGDDP
jgi:hypothetical protein